MWLLLDNYRGSSRRCWDGFVCASYNRGGYRCGNDRVTGIGRSFCGFFAAFDWVAVGIILAFATIAATTLATRATAWAIATFIAVLAII